MEKKKNTKTEKKPKKAKIIPFDKIDITTASDDDIIRSGLKHNTSKNMTCYFILFIIFVAAILPVALRIAIPRPKTEEEREIVYYDITCYKTSVRENYELSTTLVSNYRDGKVEKVTIDFKWFKKNEAAKEGYVFAEVDEFEKLKKNGITFKSEAGKAKVVMDFDSNPNLRDDDDLKDYTYFSTTEVNILTSQKGYSCVTDSKTEMEVVDIETGKKVK